MTASAAHPRALIVAPPLARRSAVPVVAGCALLALVAMLAAIAIGPVAIGVGDLLDIARHRLGFEQQAPSQALQLRIDVLESIRLPRVLLALAAGAVLACTGAVMQGLFRNPLADPGLIGVSSGAATAAVAVIVLGPGLLGPWIRTAGPWALPLAAFAGALTVTGLIYRLAQSEGRVVVATLLLAGVAANALAGALIGYLAFLSDEQQLRLLTFWTLGSVGGAAWSSSLPAIVVMVAATLAMMTLGRPLNAMLLGEDDAMHLGFDVARIKRVAVLGTAVGVGAAVSACGLVGFVGLVTPHLVRLATGPDHRVVLPASALLGAALLALADLAARLLVVPAELPLGVVTATLGSPFFLWLLLRDRRTGLAT